MHNLSSNIKSHRIQNQLTQDEIAQFLNVSKTSVSKWENNLATPDIYHLIQLSKLFNISIDRLVGHSPIQSKSQIRKQYHYFLDAFQSRTPEDVLDEVKSSAYEFYNDFEYLLSLVTLLINHLQIADKKAQTRMLDLSESFIERISHHSEDAMLRVQTHFYHAVLLDIKGDNKAVIELLKDSTQPVLPVQIILAKNYFALGKHDEADQTLQIHLYQNISSVFDTMINMIHLGIDEEVKLDVLISRVEQVEAAFNYNVLNPNMMINGYFVIAMKKAGHNEDDSAIYYLKKSLIPIRNLFENYALHGDEFFNRIDDWIEGLSLGQSAPTKKEMAQASLINILNQSPAFARLHDNKDFQNIINQINNLI